MKYYDYRCSVIMIDVIPYIINTVVAIMQSNGYTYHEALDIYWSFQNELDVATGIGMREVEDALEKLFLFLDGLARDKLIRLIVDAKYMIGWIPRAISMGIINSEWLHQYFTSSPNLLDDAPLVVMVISRGYSTVEEMRELLGGVRTYYNFLNTMLMYLFGNADVSVVIELIRDDTDVYLPQTLRCCAEVSVTKTERLAIALSSKYSCEALFSYVAVEADQYQADYELFAESAVIGSCGKPINKYQVELLSKYRAIDRLEHLLSLPKDNV